MNKPKPDNRPRKLVLKKESIASLTPESLRTVVGGQTPFVVQSGLSACLVCST